MALVRDVEKALVEAVIESFRRSAPVPARAESPAHAGETARLREVFLAAGAAAVWRARTGPTWLQVGVRFARSEALEEWLCDVIRPLVRRLADGGQLERFFFMRKPPGVRLRFEGVAPEREVWPRLRRALERGRETGRVAAFEFGVYEPEEHQFGGEVGMAIAHEYFHDDSLAALDVLAIEAGGRGVAERTVLSLTVLNDLFGQVCGDPWEEWDAWQNMSVASRGLADDPVVVRRARRNLVESRAVLELTLRDRAAVVAALSRRERELVLRCFDRNARAAERLRAALRDGALTFGPRRLLPFWVIFHWNRWGIPGHTQDLLAFYMQSLLAPEADDGASRADTRRPVARVAPGRRSARARRGE